LLRSAGVLIVVPVAHPVTAPDLLAAGYVDFLREERELPPLSVEAYRSDVVRFRQRSSARYRARNRLTTRNSG